MLMMFGLYVLVLMELVLQWHKIFSPNFCKASPCRLWNVRFYFLIFWIAQLSVVAILFVVLIRVSVEI